MRGKLGGGALQLRLVAVGLTDQRARIVLCSLRRYVPNLMRMPVLTGVSASANAT